MTGVVTRSLDGTGRHRCRHWDEQHVPFVLPERWGRDQIRASSPVAHPHAAPTRFPHRGLSPIAASRFSPGCSPPPGPRKGFCVSGVLDPSWLGCYHTRCLFFFIKRCKLCASKCWKLRIFHLFVETQTGWHNFNQTMKCSLACLERERGREGKNNTACSSFREA